jgi:hypothetical protein|tara:strand:- start:23 stop:205 length:183 start_codon:yes stop_codon:yes gene_type:complete
MILTPQIYSALQNILNEAIGVNVCENKIIEDIHKVYVDNIKETDNNKDNNEDNLRGNDYY